MGNDPNKLILFIAALVGASAPAGASGAEGRTERPCVDSALVLYEAWARAKLAGKGDPGLAMAIVIGDEIVFSKGYGLVDRGSDEAMGPQTILPASSMTKMLTATRIMQLRDQGLVSLDDPITKHLPWLKIGKLDPENPPTILQILTHTSGLPREAPFPYWTDNEFPGMEKFLESLPSTEILQPPGAKWIYSNLGYALLGLVIEKLTGKPFAQDLSESILDPLGMKRTTLGRPAVAGMATGYGRLQPGGGRAVRVAPDTGALSPALGMYTTAEDLSRFISLQFAGPGDDSILRYRSVREMHCEYWPLPQWDFAVGLGFEVKRAWGAKVVGHDGAMAGYRCRAAFRPADKVGAVVLANADDADPDAFVDQALRFVAEAKDEDESKAESFPSMPEAFKPLLGHYVSPLLSWEGDVIYYRGHLALYSYEFPPAPDPRTVLVWLEPVDGLFFKMYGPAGNGEPVLFEMDHRGEVARAKMGENWVVPAGTGK